MKLKIWRRMRIRRVAQFLEENYYTLSTTGEDAVQAAIDDFLLGYVTEDQLEYLKVSKFEYVAAIDWMHDSLGKRGLLTAPAVAASASKIRQI